MSDFSEVINGAVGRIVTPLEQLWQQVEALKPVIAAHEKQINALQADIEDLKTQVLTLISSHKSKIEDLSDRVDRLVSDLEEINL